MMNKRWLINLILLAAIAVMALLLKLQPGKEEADTNRLTSLKAGTISRVMLSRPAQENVVMEKIDGLWRMTVPLSARSNRFNISNLLKLAEAEASVRFAASEPTLEQYGLKKPAARIRLNDVELQVGNSHPIKQERYVRAGKWVYLVATGKLRMSENPYTDFISNSLLEETYKLQALDLGPQQLSLKDGKWSLTPELKQVSADDITQFVNQWQLAHALSVDRYGKKPVTQWIKLVLRENREVSQQRTIKVGVVSYKPEFVLYRPDEKLEYRFSEEMGNTLLQLKPKKTD